MADARVRVFGSALFAGVACLSLILAPADSPALEANLAEADACPAGFWRSPQNEGVWALTGFRRGDRIGTQFRAGVPHDGRTLADALRFGGGPGVDGGERILLRAAVAALLNAGHPAHDYPLSAAEVRQRVDAALAGGDRGVMLQLAGELDLLNDRPCGLEGTDSPPAAADLIVSRIDLGELDRITDRFPYTATVRNAGGAPVDVQDVGVQGWYSEDTQVGGDTPACGRTLSTTSRLLNPGAEVSVSINCSLLPQPAQRYLLVQVDASNRVEESDESNNVGVLQVPK